jgi:hypothetical protein
MKFFSPAWHRGHLSDHEAARAPAEYETHIERLVPPLPAAGRRFVREISLLDGLTRSLSVERDTLDLVFRAGDQQVGYFDARLRYTGAELTSDSESFLRAIVGDRNVDLLYDEFDSAGDGKEWIHRFLFWPYHEICVRFAGFDLEITPAARRFDEGQDGSSLSLEP